MRTPLWPNWSLILEPLGSGVASSPHFTPSNKVGESSLTLGRFNGSTAQELTELEFDAVKFCLFGTHAVVLVPTNVIPESDALTLRVPRSPTILQ
ncbi:hypothetical protein HJC23_013479 [Cyclotella cryptica]|uniref:Uncharacterized protein n=1 Tax=Cyclotella cryptica TaxID=29204 RepID=A0ABD3QC21_9STRA